MKNKTAVEENIFCCICIYLTPTNHDYQIIAIIA